MNFDLDIIREIQLEQLISLKEFDRICKKYELRYWMMYGSLIGTVRHHGFIPWDEDLDVGMMREDYEKLCAVPKTEWGNGTLFCSAKSDDIRHDVLQGRVYREKSHIQCYRDVERWQNPADRKSWSTSLMLDVFIFDHVPDDEAMRKRMYRRTMSHGYHDMYRDVKLRANPNRDTLRKRVIARGRIVYGAAMRALYKRPWAEIWNRHEKMVVNGPHGSKIGTFSTSDPFVYEENDYFPLETMTFEDMQVPVPKCWDRMLRDFYGDYMQYPPEDERYHLDFVYADLGTGKKYIFDPIPGSLGDLERKGKR